MAPATRMQEHVPATKSMQCTPNGQTGQTQLRNNVVIWQASTRQRSVSPTFLGHGSVQLPSRSNTPLGRGSMLLPSASNTPLGRGSVQLPSAGNTPLGRGSD